MMKARRRNILVVILLLGVVAASIAATVGRRYAHGICWMLGLGESTYYGWHTNLQDVTVIRHDKKSDLRVTPVEARMRA
jgi:hypothetical protein